MTFNRCKAISRASGRDFTAPASTQILPLKPTIGGETQRKRPSLAAQSTLHQATIVNLPLPSKVRSRVKHPVAQIPSDEIEHTRIAHNILLSFTGCSFAENGSRGLVGQGIEDGGVIGSETCLHQVLAFRPSPLPANRNIGSSAIDAQTALPGAIGVVGVGHHSGGDDSENKHGSAYAE